MSVFCHCNVVLSFFIWRYMFELVSGQCLFARRQNQDLTVYTRMSVPRVCNAPMSVCSMPRNLSAQRPSVFLLNTRASVFPVPVCMSAQYPSVCLLRARASVCTMLLCMSAFTSVSACLMPASQYVCSMPLCLFCTMPMRLSTQFPYVCLLNASMNACSMPLSLPA
jgi:hypothetical protein